MLFVVISHYKSLRAFFQKFHIKKVSPAKMLGLLADLLPNISTLKLLELGN